MSSRTYVRDLVFIEHLQQFQTFRFKKNPQQALLDLLKRKTIIIGMTLILGLY